MSSPGIPDVQHFIAAAFPRLSDIGIFRPRPAYAIARQGAPRWILLGDPSNSLPVLRSWRPYKLRARIAWNTVTFAASRGVLPLLPGVERKEVVLDSSYWRETLGLNKHWSVVIHVGNPSPTRKLTVFFVDADRRIQAVAKLPLVKSAGAAILHEAEMLAGLKRAPYAPRLLFRDPARAIATQSWLEGASVGRELTAAHLKFLESLRVEGTTLWLSDRRASLVAAFEAHDLPGDRELIARACDILHFDRPLPVCTEHGDFAPWNLKRLPDGQTAAIDWEWAEPLGVPCQDLCRFFYIQDVLFRGAGNAGFRMLRNPLVTHHLDRLGIPVNALIPLVAHFLLRSLLHAWSAGDSAMAHYLLREVSVLLANLRKNSTGRVAAAAPLHAAAGYEKSILP